MSLTDNKSVLIAGAVSLGAAVGCYIGYRFGIRTRPTSRTFKSYKRKEDPIIQYVSDHSLRETEILKELKEYTLSSVNESGMLCAPEEAQFFRLLLKLLNAKKTIEIGTFTGYNTLSAALALPEDGKIIACDVSEEYTSVARQFWKKADVDHKIDLRIQPANATLDELISAGEAGTFDFVFIDADKPNMESYYEKSLTLLRQGGIVALDNVLWGGSVANPDAKATESVLALRAVNQKVKSDDRVDISMLVLGDGVTLALKK